MLKHNFNTSGCNLLLYYSAAYRVVSTGVPSLEILSQPAWQMRNNLPSPNSLFQRLN